MKSKFFGLKMAVAVLAVGATFTSCYDSNQGDIYIPDEVVIPEFPDPVYVVNGTVTNFQSGAAIKGAEITGAFTATATDGFFEVKGTTPFNGDVTVSATGFYPATRTVAQSTLAKGQGTLVSNLNVTLSPEGYVPGVEVVTPTPSAADPALAPAQEATAASVASFAGFENLTDAPKQITFSPKSDLGMKLAYGAIVPAVAVDSKTLFSDFVKSTWGNDPFKGFIDYEGNLTITVYAHSRIKSLKITPLVKDGVVKFTNPEDNTPFEQKVKIAEEYKYEYVYAKLDHTHGHEIDHGHNSGTNQGGGIGE